MNTKTQKQNSAKKSHEKQHQVLTININKAQEYVWRNVCHIKTEITRLSQYDNTQEYPITTYKTSK